jgi:6-phosphogluconolactonase
VVNTGSDTVSVYAIDAAGGALSPISGSPFVTGTQPAAIAISD